MSSDSAFRIFVLEDNPADLYMIKRSIQEAADACEFVSVGNGADALDFVSSHPSPLPDLMILDCNVPKIEGTEVLEWVRGDERWSSVSIFMLTGSLDPTEIARVLGLGADRCVSKPSDLAGYERFGEAVKQWLNGARKRQLDPSNVVSDSLNGPA